MPCEYQAETLQERNVKNKAAVAFVRFRQTNRHPYKPGHGGGEGEDGGGGGVTRMNEVNDK